MPYRNRILIFGLVTLLSLASVLMLAVTNAGSFSAEVNRYLSQGRVFTISARDSASTDRVFQYLASVADNSQAVVMRADRQLIGVEGAYGGTHLGIYAQADAIGAEQEFIFLGQAVLDSGKLRYLLTQAKTNQTLGLYKNQADVIGEVPAPAFAPQLSAGKLEDLIDESGTVNGEYYLYGVNDKEFADFIVGLATVTGMSEQEIREPLSGYRLERGLLPTFALATFVSIFILLTVTLFIMITRGAQEMGVYLLLGWSKTDYLLRSLTPILYSLPLALLLSAAGSYVSLRGFAITPLVLLQLLLPFALTVATLVVAILLASLGVLGMKPVHALKGFAPQRLFLGLLAIAYLLMTCGLYASLAYLDGPIKEVNKLSAVQQGWKTVANRYVLYSHQSGADNASFSQQSLDYAQDFYNWYSSIEEQPGVSLVNTHYVNRELLDQWQSLGMPAPDRQYWYMAASPSYLKEVGVSVPAHLIEQANAGERVYLIPEHFSPEDRQGIEEYLTDEAQRLGAAKQEITTAFTREKKVSLSTYSPPELFTWNTNIEGDFESRDVVIYLAVAENMTYFETESLAASGLENSYVKLSEEAVEKFTSADYLTRYNLEDNEPVFIPSEQFVAGLQKSIQQYLLLFASVTAVLALLSVLFLVAMVNLYSMLKGYELAVLKLLGYSTWRSFIPVLLYVLSLNTVGLIVVILLQAKIGVIGACAMLLLGLAVVTLLAQKYSRSYVLQMIKSS